MAPHQTGVIGQIWPDSVCDVAWDTWPGQLRYNIITIIETNRPSQQGGADNDFLWELPRSIENIFKVKEIFKTLNYLP